MVTFLNNFFPQNFPEMKTITKSKYRNLIAARPLNGKLQDIILRLEMEMKLKEASQKFNALDIKNDAQEPSTSQLKQSSRSQPNSIIWKSHVAFKESWEQVCIQSIELQQSSTTIFITPLSCIHELYEYLQVIKDFYLDCGENLKPVDPKSLKPGDLIIYPYDEEFLYRSEVLSTGPIPFLRLIDFGNKFAFDMKKRAYPALMTEKVKPAYGLEVSIKNPEVLKEIRDELEVSIKFVSGASKTVIIKSKDENVVQKPTVRAPSKPSRFINNKIISSEAIVRRQLQFGESFKLL